MSTENTGRETVMLSMNPQFLPLIGRSRRGHETKGDIARRRWKRAAFSMGFVVLIAGGLYAFHTLVMDLDILWIKISMRLNLLV